MGTMKIIRTRDEAWVDGAQRGKYSQRRKKLGGDGFSSSLWELPPGKKSFPFHKHNITEEALFVVSGKAKVRSSDGLTEVGQGDFVHFAPGIDAHQLINDGSEPFVYLAIGVSKGADVTEFPDSKKISAGVAGANPKSFAFLEKDKVDYYLGESDAD